MICLHRPCFLLWSSSWSESCDFYIALGIMRIIGIVQVCILTFYEVIDAKFNPSAISCSEGGVWTICLLDAQFRDFKVNLFEPSCTLCPSLFQNMAYWFVSWNMTSSMSSRFGKYLQEDYDWVVIWLPLVYSEVSCVGS